MGKKISSLDAENFWKANKGNAKFYTECEEKFTKKYVVQNGYDEIFEYNERSLYKPSQEPFFIPGKIYTFLNTPKKESYDGQPIVFVTSLGEDKKKGKFIHGLNFNNVPGETRMQILDVFENIFTDELKLQDEAAAHGETYIPKNLIECLKDTKFVMSIFEKASVNAYSKFYLCDIKQPSLFEFDDWKIIPFLNPKNLVGLTLLDLIAKFLKMSKDISKSKINEIVKDAIKSGK